MSRSFEFLELLEFALLLGLMLVLPLEEVVEYGGGLLGRQSELALFLVRIHFLQFPLEL
jgi:hypothetical protein